MKKVTISFFFIAALLAGLASPVLAHRSTVSLSGRDVQSLVFVTNKDGNDVSVIDTGTGRRIARFICSDWCNPYMSMLTPDGRKLIVLCTSGNHATVFDTGSGEVLAKIETGLSPEHLDISPDSRLAYICNHEESTISVIDLAEMIEISQIEGFSEPHGVSFLPDGKKAYVANCGAHEVGVIDTQTHQLIKRIAIGGNLKLASFGLDRFMTEIHCACSVTLTPDGRYGYVADCDAGVVTVIDTGADRVIANIAVGVEPSRAYSSPTGSLMLVPNFGDETVSIISTETNKVIATLPGGKDMTGINFVNEGKKAYVISSKEGTVYVYDLQKLKNKGRVLLDPEVTLGTASTDLKRNMVYVTSPDTNSLYVIEGTRDRVSVIPNTGHTPWSVYIPGGFNYHR